MNFGIIGPGKMGQLYIRDFIKCGARLTYIKASTIKRTNIIIKKFLKEGQPIDNNIKSLDFLIISSKTNTHYKYIKKFYKKKK
jgi:glutamyl-tRNA reductase